MNGTGNSIFEPRQNIARYAYAVAASAATAATTTVGMKIKYVGTASAATVEIVQATGITFTVGGSADTTVVASTGIVDYATFTTMGAVVDQINQSKNWKAYLVGCLRADASASQLYVMASTALTPSSGDLSCPALVTTNLATSVRMGCRESVNGTEEKGAVELYSIVSICTGTTPVVKIYEIDEALKTETLVYSALGGASNTENTKSFVSNGKGGFSCSKVGKHLLIRVATTSTHTANQLTVIGAIDKGM